jgi:hypothetical protein
VSSLDPVEPRTPPLPAGITGIPQIRRWDASALVSVAGLVGRPVAEVELLVLADGTIFSPEGVAPESLAAFARALEGGIEPPFAALAVRRSELEWAVGARTVDAETIDLPPGLEASTIEVVVSPDGDVTTSVDGDLPGVPAPDLVPAAVQIEHHGRSRFQSFVARADRVGSDRWAVTVEPL